MALEINIEFILSPIADSPSHMRNNTFIIGTNEKCIWTVCWNSAMCLSRPVYTYTQIEKSVKFGHVPFPNKPTQLYSYKI
jgi:hypothetical protein